MGHCLFFVVFFHHDIVDACVRVRVYVTPQGGKPADPALEEDAGSDVFVVNP